MELAWVGRLHRRVALLMVGMERKGRSFGGSCQFSIPSAFTRSFGRLCQHTVESGRGTHDGLDDAQNAFQPLFDVCIFGQNGVLLAEHDLQVIVRLLALQITYPLVQAIDLVLCALSDCTLGLAVVCALAGELLGREVGDTTRIGACPALFVGVAIGGPIVSRGPFGCICLARRRHAQRWVCDAIQEGFGQILPRVMSLDTAWKVASTRFARRALGPMWPSIHRSELWGGNMGSSAGADDGGCSLG